jgi:hypothetical protein
MARGWESKWVEEQQAEAVASSRPVGVRPGLDETARQQRGTTLQLSRKLVIQQLQGAENPRHRQMLEAALADLEAKLADLR